MAPLPAACYIESPRCSSLFTYNIGSPISHAQYMLLPALCVIVGIIRQFSLKYRLTVYLYDVTSGIVISKATKVRYDINRQLRAPINRI